jgi:hypothetical protein
MKEVLPDEWSYFRSASKEANEETTFNVRDLDEGYSYEIECIPIGKKKDNEVEEDDENEDF